MIVSRPHNTAEPDLLKGFEHKPLRFVSAEGREISVKYPPPTGWTHDRLEQAEQPKGRSWDAFLGTQWIGSSEI